jgi:hypothetical protein
VLPVRSVGIRRFRPAVALAADQAALVVVAQAGVRFLNRLFAFASATDVVPVELWITRLRYP